MNETFGFTTHTKLICLIKDNMNDYVTHFFTPMHHLIASQNERKSTTRCTAVITLLSNAQIRTRPISTVGNCANSLKILRRYIVELCISEDIVKGIKNGYPCIEEIEKHAGLCLGRRPCTSHNRVQGRSEGTTPSASDLHNAWTTILNPLYNMEYI